jgi:soluble lytic murein transglycosylase-like protein
VTRPRTAVTIAIAAAALAALAALPARADYAVLRSGARLHITGYEQVDDRIALTVSGGTVEIASDDLVSVEPEDNFAAMPAAVNATDNDQPFADLIHSAATKHGVDEKLIRHVIAAESNFNPRAVSRKQAQGLMQLLPKTAALYSVANVFDPAQNIEAGTHYLKDLLVRYSGNLTLALAAYNAGPEVVDRFGGVPPFAETRDYVARITAGLARDSAKN